MCLQKSQPVYTQADVSEDLVFSYCTWLRWLKPAHIYSIITQIQISQGSKASQERQRDEDYMQKANFGTIATLLLQEVKDNYHKCHAKATKREFINLLGVPFRFELYSVRFISM